MIKKSLIAILAISAFSAPSQAYEYSKFTHLDFYGDFSYDIDGESLSYKNKLHDSAFGLTIEQQIKKHIKVNIDYSYSNKIEFIGSGNDEWNHNLNEFNIEYHDFDNDAYFTIGRQFTPIGINYNKPFKDINLFSTQNPYSSLLDGINFVYDKSYSGLDLKLNGFWGTRFDDSAISTIYGGNIKFGTQSFGHINFGYMNTSIDGSFNIINSDGSLNVTDRINVYNLSYLYNNYDAFLLADYNFLDYDNSKDDIEQLNSKIGYKISYFTPYLTYSDKSFYNENILTSHSNLKSYGAGIDLETSYGFVFGIDFESQELSSDFVNIEEDVLSLKMKFLF